jgi:hypothetical protein
MIGVAALLAAVTAVAEPLLFDNGPFLTGIGIGADGANVSQTESGTPLFAGINALGTPQFGGAVRIADDFMVNGSNPRGWRLSRMTWYGIEPTSSGSTANPLTLAYVAIYGGSPLAGAELIAGDFTTNRLMSGAWSGAYRTSGSNPLATTYPIMALEIDMSWAPPLTDGRYYVAVSLGNENAPGTGVFSSPVTPRRDTDNADRYVSDIWVASSLDFPFQLFGACPGDFNGFGGVTVQDIFDFLAAFFGGAPAADINGQGGITVQDIFDFLSSFFGDCL